MTHMRAAPFWFKWIQPALAVLLLAVLLFKVVPLLASTSDFSMSQSPMYLGANEPPLMMMVMSRDEQLFNRAYSDYTDLDDDGTIDTTYTDAFDYSGYFDPKLCYTYGSSVFKASAVATGTYSHQCSGNWSGNFLNWATMSRLDLLRFVLYGGRRSTDSVTTTGGYQTVLERSYVPNDGHAWVKVYSGSDISSYTPYSSTMSFCNASLSTSGPPLMRAAKGSYTEWAATAVTQCPTYATAASKSDVPGSSVTVTDFTVRADVCGNSDSSLRESFCRSYSDGTYTYYRPAGLLQQYGESGKLRFGLLSGSYDLPRAGGVLRRNIGRFAGNSAASYCATGDEVNMQNGRFCYLIDTTSSTEGIVKTMDNFKLTNWTGTAWSDCNSIGILNRNGYASGAGYGWLKDPGSSGSGSYACNGWGNPLAEMYAEALKYIAGGSKTAAFNSSTSSDTVLGLPVGIGWKDPYASTSSGGLGYSFCSSCSILILSSGPPSFDSDAIPSVTGTSGSNVLGTTAAAATSTVGSNEGVNGTNVFLGRDVSQNSTLTTTYADVCHSVTLSNLSNALGICPDSPSTEGSYMVAGLAYKAATQDLRPDLVTTDGKSSSYKNAVKTYAVQMAESLPSFQIPVGSSTITLSPLCQGSLVSSPSSTDVSLRTCSLNNVSVGKASSSVSPNYVYGRDLQYASGTLVAGSYKMVWDNNLWGFDHDNDVVTLITFCVGSYCTKSGTNTSTGYDICWRSDSAICTGTGSMPSVGSSQVLVRVELLSAYAGTGLRGGFSVTGSDSDGTKIDLLRPGTTDGSYLNSSSSEYSSWSKPKVYRFTATGTTTSVLENPLWYAAKYGDFTDSNSNSLPDEGEWDSATSGTPDGYFLARDPSKLQTRLKEIFESAATNQVSVSGGTSGNVLDSSSFSVVSSFTKGDDSDWTGDVVATSLSSGSQLWSAAAKLDATSWSERTIFTAISPTLLNTDGSVGTAVSAGSLTATNIPGTTWKAKMAALGLNTANQDTLDWLGSTTVDALLNYLKGMTNTSLRTRSSLLGDIVNSGPAIALSSDDYGWYSSWAGTSYASLATSYQTFLSSKASTTPAVYVGGNDGMLHAFSGSLSSGGGELFAFVPYSARLHLGELANPDYDHQYYVDGPVSLGDAYYSSAWHTVVVGSTGAGGAQSTDAGTLPQGSVFALDVTSPESMSASKVLWELSGQNDNDLGQVTGSAVIVPVKSGSGVKFVAIFGNGVNSANGNPVLYVVDIGTGAVLRRLSPTGTAYQGKNGIVNVAAAALANTSGLADTVYAGDLRGNVWKFDLSSDTVSDWSVSFSGTPLFQALNGDGEEQPITGHLLLKSASDSGMMIYFGTGRYFASGDVSDTTVQSLYGIRDDLSSAISDRSELVEQTLTSATSSVTGYSVRNVTNNTVNYAVKRGWYVDLAVDGNAEGERFIGTPYLLSGEVYFTTYTPTEGSDCSGGGENWEYALGATSGGGSLSGLATASGTTICTGTCGAVQVSSSSSSSSSSTASVAPITSVSLVRTSSDTSTSSTSSTGTCTMNINASGTSTVYYVAAPCGRQSWRELR